MKAQAHDFIVSDTGAFARLKDRTIDGWTTWGDGLISEEELARRWHIVTLEDGKALYLTRGRSIDPPKPKTERVHWSKLVKSGTRRANCRLANGSEVTYISVFSDGSATIKATGGNEVRTSFDGMVEVLVDD